MLWQIDLKVIKLTKVTIVPWLYVYMDKMAKLYR